MAATTGQHDLFGLDPTEFIAARDALAKELRSTGDKDSAAAVKKLRRPSIPAWALNQVARTAPDAVATLAQTEADARAAQEKALRGGDADGLRIATTARRAAIDAIVQRANAIVAASGRSAESYEREIHSAVTAIAGSEALIAELQQGELQVIEMPETDFFGGLDVADLPKPKPKPKPERKLAAVPKPPPEPPKPPAPPAPPKPSPELVKARKRLEKARADAQAAVERLAAANQALRKAEDEVRALETNE